SKPYSAVKAFPFEQTKAPEDTADGYLVRGAFTTSGRDRDGESLVTGGILNWDEFTQNPALLYNHREHIGHSVELKRHADRIETVSLLAKGHELVEKTVWPLVRSGSLRTFSIGFSALAGHNEPDKDTYYIDEWNLYEHSLVTIPANPEAQVYLKGLGIALEEDEGLGGYSWPDADAPVEEAWPAIAVLAARIAGARGGLGITPSGRAKAWRKLLTHYADLGKEPPELGDNYAKTAWHNDEQAIFEDTEAAESTRSARGLVIGLRDLAHGRRKTGGDLPADVLATATETQAALRDLLEPPRARGGDLLAKALSDAGFSDGGTTERRFSDELARRLSEVK
ncbi:MAG TPA: HK97 family phage prohead protease, partial [Thermoleophilia bacterium]|nr:HK97 family phage prohead protease [Thermoleophilia bacterium]